MTRARNPWHLLRALLSVLCSLLLTLVAIPLTATAADNDAELSIEQYIAGHLDEVPTFAPGQDVIFTVNIQCSSTETGTCLDAVLVDELPEPLVFDEDTPMSITPNIATGTVDGRKLTVTFNGAGFEAGQIPTVTINARVPARASGDFDARTLRNPVTISASNADPVTDTVALKLAIPTSLEATATKSAAPEEALPALPGRAVSFAIAGSNASNVSVDTLTLADPADLAAATFDRLAITSLGDLTATGADRVALDWYDGEDWHEGSAAAIPADPATLLPSDPAAIRGLRLHFTKDGGQLPSGASASARIEAVSRDNFGDVGADETIEVRNTVAATVVRGDNSDTSSASDAVSFQKQPVKVTATKQFTNPELVSGRSTTATITTVNGVMPVSRLEISEPAPGQPDLAAQGLGFGGFVVDPEAPQVLMWPTGAERAEITYRYDAGEPETLSTTLRHSLPAPGEGRTVTGFTVAFSADGDGIGSRARTVLPFQVTAGQVRVEEGVTATNTVRATATSSAPDSGSDEASASLTLLPLRVRVAAGKTIVRDTIWAHPGTTDTVSLTGRVVQSSTIGADYLTLTDTDAGFWDHFDLRRIHSTDIPANADLTVSYFDGSVWLPLTEKVAGPVQDWVFTPSAEQRATIVGLRFGFEPRTADAVLPAGFNVAPRFDVALRRTLRSDQQVTTNLDATIANDVTVEVGNEVAIEPVRTDTAGDTMRLRKTDTGGGSLWLVTKRWLDPVDGSQTDAGVVSALSDDLRTAVVAWGTDGLSLSELRLLDDPGYADPAGSFYDAFDLVRIQPITPAIDPEIAKDKVGKVELYSSAANDWVDITAAACPTAGACDGRFTGYTLTADEQRTTLAARLTIVPGSGSDTGEVALSDSAHRQLRLDFRLRRSLRSNPAQYVLGETHGHAYNSGTAGTVTNRVIATGVLTEPDAGGGTTVSSTTSSDLAVLDQPLNVSLTKEFDQTQLGLPQRDTTAAGDYPLVTATLTATNQTAGAVPQLVLTDPADTAAGFGGYARLNLHQIELTGIPAGLTATDVVVELTGADGGVRQLSVADAQALPPAELADVVGVRVSYGAYDNLAELGRPLIEAGATATVLLTYQLRSDVRGLPGTPVVDGDHVVNSARAVVLSPGGIVCTGEDACDRPSATATDNLAIVQPTYSVIAGRSLNWTSRYEDQSATGYVVTLTGQPDGTARTRLLSLTDAAPTFWNAFDLAGVPTITVPDPMNELRLSVLTGVDFTPAGAALGYQCDGSADLTACWHTGQWQAANSSGQVSLTPPTGVTADQVRGVRIEAQRRIDGAVMQWERPANPTLTVRLNVTRRATLRHGPDGGDTTAAPTTRAGQPTAPGETAQAVTTGQVIVTGTGAWMRNTSPYTDTQTAAATTRLRHRVNAIKVEKTPGQGAGSQAPRYDLDAAIPYQVKITNTGAWRMTGLELTDRIDLVGGASPLVGADVNPVFSVKLDGAPVTGFTTSLDPATGELAIGVPDDFVLAPSQVLLITANLRFRDRLEAGTEVTNTVTATTDRPFETCEYTNDAMAQEQLSDQLDCSSRTRIVTAASSPMSVTKTVRGDGAGLAGATPDDPNYDDLGVIAVGEPDASACAYPGAGGFYSYPCTPITRPGGKQVWRVTVANNGNVPANTISAIDVLPTPGDTGVVVGTSRKSRFTPTFLGEVAYMMPEVAADHTVRSFYTTVALGPTCNKADILNDTRPAGQDDCDIEWHPLTQETPADDLAAATALKFVLSFADPGAGLDPGQRFSVSFSTRSPAYAELADPTTLEPVAWNSVAVGARTADFQGFAARASLVTEPRKVGVALATGALDLAKRVDAPADVAWLGLLPDSYQLKLACTSQGEEVPLRASRAGSDTSTVSLPADGEVVHYNGSFGVNLPLGAECGATETAVQGAEASYSADSVVAARSYAGIANVAHGHAGKVTAGALTVTNTYREAGFTLTKAVTGPTALDAAGAPVHFKDATVTASCSFLGEEVVPELSRTVGVRGGTVTRFTDLPAGADCAVAETYPAGAAATSIAVTQDGETELEDASAAEFTLLAGEEPATTVALTNSYTVGAVEITKQLAGSGAAAWGDQPFEAQLSCTHPDADPGLVYSARHTLTADDTVWQVRDLPTGAECAVTETRTGGANSFTVAGGELTVGNDPEVPAEATITNTFTTGTVEVTKRVQANGATTTASPWADAGFEVTLACTRSVDGANLPVAIPGGATRTLDRGGSWKATFTGLPTGASCAVTEGAATIAGQPAPGVTITGPVTVGSSTPAAITVTNNYRAGKLAITKTLTGVGAGFFSGAQFSVSCTLDGYDDPVFTATRVAVTKAALYSDQLGPLPFGADCTVTETATGGADATPAPQVIEILPNAEAGDVAIAAFTNAFSAGKVTLTKTLTGEAASEAWATGATFTLALKCGLTENGPYSYNAEVFLSGGQQTTITDAQGNVRLFPLGTHCWATETGTQGAVTSVVDHDSFADGVIVTAAPEAVQDLRIGATNSYTYGGFTITKDVVTSGATDQDGNLLVYTPSFSINVNCMFLGRSVKSETFTLTKADGGWGSRTYEKLPTGASCTIIETNRGSATATSVQVTSNGAAGPVTNSDRVVVAAHEGDATAGTVAFTNTYGVGRATITKSITGNSTWATAEFTVHLECTAGFIAGTVYSKDFIFKAGGTMSATIENLPTGASCVTTEPENGGANGVPTFTNGSFTVSNGGTTAVTVRNNFTVGTVRVTKALRAGGLTTQQPWASAQYTVTLGCTRSVNGVTETLTVPNATKVITGAGSVTWPNLPTGARCAATEDAISYPEGTPAQPAPSSVAFSAPVTVTTSTVTQTITNNFAYGGVAVTKQLTGEAAARYGSGTFGFDIVCTLTGTTGNVYTRNLTMQRTGSQLTLSSGPIGTIPEGSMCTITETNPAGATSVTPASRSIDFGPIVAGEQIPVTFSNEFRYAGFTVTKTVDDGGAVDADGEPIDYAGSFGFTAACMFNGANVIPVADRTFTLTRTADGAWSSKAFSQLPSGAPCTVTETADANADSTSVRVTQGDDTLVDATASTTGAFTLATGDATTTQVDFTNRYPTGSLTITKQVGGDGAALWGGGTFTLALACTLDLDADSATPAVTVYNAQRQLTAGQAWSVTDLPTGASCVLTEPKSAGANSTSISAPTPTITDGDQPITVTNTFTTGSVRVAKAIRVNGAARSAQPWSSGSYPVTLSCTRDFDSDGTPEAFVVPDATKTITGAGTASWTGLPRGATCTVTEGTSTVTSQPQPVPSVSSRVTVGASQVTLTLTNDFTAGKLVVHKDITGDGAVWGKGPFTAAVSCTLPGHGTVFATSVTLTPATGQTSLDSAALGPIPVGASCSVSETATAGATVVSTPSPVTIALDPETDNVTTLTLTNEFRHAGFTVTKTVDNGGAEDADGQPIGYAGSFSFTASCTFNGAEVVPTADRSFTLTPVGDGSWTSKAFSNLPSGASCTLTETGKAGAVGTSVRVSQNGDTLVESATATTGAFTLAAGDATTTAVGFTNRYATGSLAITKQVTGAGATQWGGGSFTLALVCTFDHDADSRTAVVTVHEAEHRLVGGQTWQVENLPVGVNCVLTEPGTAGATSTSIPAGGLGLPVAAVNEPITVTNTFSTGIARVTKAIRVNGAATTAEPWASGTYPITLHCTRDFDDDGVAEELTIPNPTRTITGAGWYAWGNLPYGASCTVTEGTSTVSSQPQPVATVAGAGVIGASTLQMTLTNDFTAGKLVVHKDVTGDGARWATRPFTAEVTCTLEGHDTVYSNEVVFTPTADKTSFDSAALGPIPVGSVCAVEETDRGGATVVTTPEPVTIALNPDTNNVTTLSLTNEFQQGGFTVTKAVDNGGATDAAGDPVGYDAANFTATCSFNGAQVIAAADREFKLAGGQSKSFTGLPTGATCTVRETWSAGAASVGTTLTQNGSPATDTDDLNLAVGFILKTGDADTTTVDFTNTYTTGNARISKVVAGAGATLWADAEFTVRLRCTLGVAAEDVVHDATHQVTTDDPVTIASLPTGAACTVTETAAGAANASVVTGGTFTIGTADTKAATVTNTYTLGAVRVAKQLTLDGSATTAKPWTDGSYTVELACTRQVNGVATAISIPGGASRTITGAGSASYTNLPTGASCKATETASSPASQQTTISAPVTVGANPAAPQAITVANDFHTARFSIRKQLTGAGSDAFGSGPFDFSVTCTLAGAGQVFTTTTRLSRPAGSTATSLTSGTFGPVPVGAVCQVTETARGGADATAAPVTLTIAEDDADNVATLTNQFSAGTLWLSKVLDGAAAAEDWATEATFAVDVTCQVEIDDEPSTVFSRRVSLAGGERVQVTDADGRPSRIPLGARCFSDEVDAQGATSSQDAHDSFDNALVVTAGTPASLQALELKVTNTFEYAGFTVTKTVADGGAVDADGEAIEYLGEYAFWANCSLAGRSVLAMGFPLTGGGSGAFSALPAGAACTVRETSTAAAAGTSVTITQNGKAATPVTGTSATFTLQRGWLPLLQESPAHNQAAFTNSYTTGAASLTKAVAGTGAAAWGKGPFTLRLVCTLDTDADPDTSAATVFDGTRQVSPASPTWTIRNLPTGAACTVTEPATGGANTPATQRQFVVGANQETPTAITLTNTFTTGSVVLGKTILVDGEESDAEPYADAEYIVQLRCTREVNGLDVAVDIPGDSAPAGDDADGVRTITGAGSVRYDGLPTGADCTATELSASLPLPASQVDDADSVTVPATGAAELEIANDYHTGELVVAKLLAGAGATAWGGGEFRFDLRCTLTDTDEVAHPVFTATGLRLSRALGLTSGSLGPIPVGSDCTVTETASAGADQPAGPVTVTIADGEPTTASLTNTFNQGSVRIRLGVTVDRLPTTLAPYVTGSYATELSCTRQVNGLTVPVTIPGGAGWTTTGPGERLVTGLPVGASCTVSQQYSSLTPHTVSYHPVAVAPVDPDAPVESDPVESDPVESDPVESDPVESAPVDQADPVRSGAVAVVSGEPEILDIVDDFALSTLVLTKELAGAGAADHADQPFEFSLACTLAEDEVTVPHLVYTGSLSLSRATGLDSTPQGPIPVGAECVITETAVGGASTPAEPVVITIAADPTVNEVTMTNAFETGTVTVNKQLTVDGLPSSAEPYASGSYTVELGCTRLVDGHQVAVQVPGGSTRTITGAGTVEFTGLPLGADCQVSESASSLAIPADQVRIAPATVVVGAAPVSVLVTNDFRTGTLVLRWSQTGVGRGFAGAARFTVDCTLPGATGSVFHKELELTPVEGQDWVESDVLGPIPIGASCIVTERTAGGADAIAEPVMVTGEQATVLAEIGNEYSAGVVTVTKQLTGPGASLHLGTTFRVAVTCAASIDGVPYRSGEVAITGAGTAVLLDDTGLPVLLPAGTRCWGAETETGGAQISRVDHDRFDNAAMVTPDDPGTLQVLTITVTNGFARDSLAWTGPGPGSWWLLVLSLGFLCLGAGLIRWGSGPGRLPRRAQR